MADEAKKRIAVLGASGGIGRRIVRRALGQGYALTCQTRTAGKLADVAGSVEIHAFAPTDAAALGTFVKGADAVIFALGVDAPGATTLFSDATQALVAAMQKAGVKRLIAVTGVGAGETRGHGGFFYDRIIFPLFTRQRHADKDRQEALIAASELDWIIVRPAPFAEAAATGPLQVHTRIAPETVLRRITRDEVAAFVVAQIGDDRYLRQRPFIGHP